MEKLIKYGVAKNFIALEGGSNTSSIEVSSKEIEEFINFFELDKEWDFKYTINKTEYFTGKIKLEDRKKNPSLKWNTSVSNENAELWKKFQMRYKYEYELSGLTNKEYSSSIILEFTKENDEITLYLDSSKLPESEQVTFNEEMNYEYDPTIKSELKYQNFHQFIKQIDKLYIPFYQRDYTWEFDKEIQDLIDDIIYTYERNKLGEEYYHFMGNILLSDNKVVDGQQRITSMMLVYIALDKITGDNKSEELFLNNKQLKVNNKYLEESIVNLIKKEKCSVEQLEQNISRLDRKFREVDDIKGLYHLGISRLIFLFQELEENFDENMVYETMNSRGKEITNYDLIKAYLLNFNILERDLDKYEEIIEKKSRNNQLANENDLIDLLRYYIAIRTGKLYSKDKRSSKGETLYKGYKNYIFEIYNEKMVTEEIFEKEIKLLEKYSQAFSKIQKDEMDYPIEHTFSWIKNCYEEYTPILIELQKQRDEHLTESDFNKILKYFTKYIIYKMLTTTKKNSHTYPLFAHYLSKEEISYAKFIDYLDSDEHLKNTYHMKKYKNPTGEISYASNIVPKNILEFLERTLEEETIKNAKMDIELEHIYPQNPNGDHSNFYLENTYNKLGNFLLLGNKFNGLASNGILKDKISEYKKSDYILTKNFLEKYGSKEEFTDKDIEERTKNLISEIKNFFE